MPWWAWVIVAIVSWSAVSLLALFALAAIGSRTRRIRATGAGTNKTPDETDHNNLVAQALEQRSRILGESVDQPEITPIWRLHYGNGQGADLRQMGPMRVCVCGCDLWRALVSWDEECEISFWFLDVVCASCGALATAVTPLDYFTEDGESV